MYDSLKSTPSTKHRSQIIPQESCRKWRAYCVPSQAKDFAFVTNIVADQNRQPKTIGNLLTIK